MDNAEIDYYKKEIAKVREEMDDIGMVFNDCFGIQYKDWDGTRRMALYCLEQQIKLKGLESKNKDRFPMPEDKADKSDGNK